MSVLERSSDVEEINHIPCSLHVRVALQSGLGVIWT